MQLYERLGIPCGVTAVIGSGGKVIQKICADAAADTVARAARHGHSDHHNAYPAI